MGWMKNKRRREREAKQSRKLEAEWWYEPNIEIEHVPEQLGEEEITPPIDNEYLINNALDNDDLNTEWYIRLSWDTCTEQLKQLKIAQRNGGNSLTNAQSQYEIKKTRLQNELKTATNTLTAPGTISKNKILGTTYGLSHGIFLNNLNDNDIQTIKTLGFNLIASELAYHTLESSIPAIAADIAHSEGYQGQGRRLGVIDSNIEVQNIAFGCDEEVSPSQMDPTCDKVTGYNFRHFYKGDATDDIVFPPGEPYSFSFSYCQAYPADAVCDWCRYGSIADQRCDPWDTWWSDIVCQCGQWDVWSTINSGVECLTDGTFANDCDIYDSIYAIGKNPGIGTEQEGPGGSYHSHSEHGHHVASTVAGYDSQDGSGTVGVAPGSEIVHFKGEQNSGSFPQWELYLALELAIRETPSLDAINMSLGSKDSPMWCYDLYVPAIQPLVEMVNNAGAIGLQVVTSAGNSGPKTVTYSTAHNSQPYGDFLYYYGRAGLLDDVLPDLDIYNWNSQTINPAFQNVKKYEDMYSMGCYDGNIPKYSYNHECVNPGDTCGPGLVWSCKFIWYFTGLSHYFSLGKPATAHAAITVTNADTSRYNTLGNPVLGDQSSRGPSLPYKFTCGGGADDEECQKRCVGSDIADISDVSYSIGQAGSNIPLRAEILNKTWDSTRMAGYASAIVEPYEFDYFAIMASGSAEAIAICEDRGMDYVSHTMTADTIEMDNSIGLILRSENAWVSACHWVGTDDECDTGFKRRNFFHGPDSAGGWPNISKETWDAGYCEHGDLGAFQWNYELEWPWGTGGDNTAYGDGTYPSEYNGQWVAWEQEFSNHAYLNKHCGVTDDGCDSDFWDGCASFNDDYNDNGSCESAGYVWMYEEGKCCQKRGLGQSPELLNNPMSDGSGWYVYESINGPGAYPSTYNSWRCCDNHVSRLGWGGDDPGDNVDCDSDPNDEAGNAICWNKITGYALKSHTGNPNLDSTPRLDGTGCGRRPPCSHAKMYRNAHNVVGTTTIAVDYESGWNLVGLPLEVANSFYTSVFPSSVDGSLYSFNGTYENANQLIPGEGYWLLFDTAGTEYISGSPLTSLPVSLTTGWNLISGISTAVDINSAEDPEDIIVPGTLYGFSGTYQSSSALFPGKGYWINASADGEITLGSVYVEGSVYVDSDNFYNGYDSDSACADFYDAHDLCPTYSSNTGGNYCQFDAWKMEQEDEYGCGGWDVDHTTDTACTDDGGIWLNPPGKCCAYPRVCLAQGLTDAQCAALEGKCTGENPCSDYSKDDCDNESLCAWENAPCCQWKVINEVNTCVAVKTMYPGSDAYTTDTYRSAAGYDNTWYHLEHALESVSCEVEDPSDYKFQIIDNQPCEMVGRGAFLDSGRYTWNRDCSAASNNEMLDNSDYDMAATAGLCSKGCWHYSEECGDLTGEYESVCTYVSSETCDCKPVTEPLEIAGNEYGWSNDIIAAPGTNICAAGFGEWFDYDGNGLLENDYEAWGFRTQFCSPCGYWEENGCCEGAIKSGTSMAAPHVTGAVGVIKGANPDLSNDQVKEILFNTTTSMEINGIPYENGQVGSGLINVYDAVTEALMTEGEEDDGDGNGDIGCMYGQIQWPSGEWEDGCSWGDCWYDCSDDMSNINIWGVIAFRACCNENLMGECSTWVLMGHDLNGIDPLSGDHGEWFTDLYSPCSGNVACATGPYNTEFEPEVFDCNCPCSTGIPQCPNGEPWDPCHEEDASEGDPCFSYTPDLGETIYYECICD